MHTPSPWHARKLRKRGFSGTDAFIWIEAAQCKIAESCWEQHAENECEANARLIAAAPDLLESAKAVIQWLRPTPNHFVPPVLRQLEAAVNKATEEGA